jgi:hypothetical protein
MGKRLVTTPFSGGMPLKNMNGPSARRALRQRSVGMSPQPCVSNSASNSMQNTDEYWDKRRQYEDKFQKENPILTDFEIITEENILRHHRSIDINISFMTRSSDQIIDLKEKFEEFLDQFYTHDDYERKFEYEYAQEEKRRKEEENK